MSTKRSLTSIALAMLLIAPFAQARQRHRVKNATFTATAYAQHGVTNSGIKTQNGVVAADPQVLPLGTVIHVQNAGEYSGTYVVADTGTRIRGRRIDIFIPSRLRCRLFGKRKVQVTVLQRPPNT